MRRSTSDRRRGRRGRAGGLGAHHLSRLGRTLRRQHGRAGAAGAVPPGHHLRRRRGGGHSGARSTLADRLRAEGREARVIRPTAGKDANDVLRREGRVMAFAISSMASRTSGSTRPQAPPDGKASARARTPPLAFELADWDAKSLFAGDAPPQEWLVGGVYPAQGGGPHRRGRRHRQDFTALELCLRVTRGPMGGTHARARRSWAGWCRATAPPCS